MKKIILTSMILGSAVAAQAQETFLNDQMTNTSGELYGTARFVGMGGAMGALGADISTISWNPAGLGLIRKSEVGFTAGAIWDKDAVKGLNRAHATLDQMGGVFSLNLDNDKMNYINVGFNYQKKKNFCNAFAADNLNLGIYSNGQLIGGHSLMTELADIVNDGYDTGTNLAGWALDNKYLTRDATTGRYYNKYNAERNRFTQRTWGSLNAFDFNFSGNVKNQVFWGLTFGFDQLRYRAQTDYFEKSSVVEDGVTKDGDFSAYNDKQLDGFGFNIKAGLIVRPIADNPFRFGLAIETPTWYQIKSSTFYQLTDHVDNVATSQPESYLEYHIRTPWKFRAGLGTTVGTQLALDVDYEYANYGLTKMGYPNNSIGDSHNTLFSNSMDDAMNDHTSATLKAVHNVRAGVEYKPTKALAVRAGYNFATCSYKDNPTYDQLGLDSKAMDYATSAHYMKLSAMNTLTLGVGYRWKYVNLDVAYKLQNQKADFYSFYVPTDGAKFNTPNVLAPVRTDLTRHQITATLGLRF